MHEDTSGSSAMEFSHNAQGKRPDALAGAPPRLAAIRTAIARAAESQQSYSRAGAPFARACGRRGAAGIDRGIEH